MKIDLKLAIITFKDGSGSPKSLEINIGEGTLTWSEKVTREYVKNRGLLDTVRNGDEEPVDIRFDLVWEFLRSMGTATTPTPYEVLNHFGEAASWVTTDSDLCAPFAIDLQIVYTPGCGAETAETILFSDFRHESLDGDAKAGTLTVSGKANITRPSTVRAA